MLLGWIKLHRQILDWEWYSDINCSRLFIHLLLTANAKDKTWKGIEVKRGQLITSLQNLSVETGLTLQQLRTAIKKLKSTQEITIKSTSKYTAVTVVNYEDYQDCGNDSNKVNNTESNNQATNEQQTSNKQIITTKESKKVIIQESKKEVVGGILKELTAEYEHYMNRFASAAVSELFQSYLSDGMEAGVIRRAIYKANDDDKRELRYIQGILNGCMTKGILTESAFLEDCRKWRESKTDRKKEEQIDYDKEWEEIWNDAEG